MLTFGVLLHVTFKSKVFPKLLWGNNLQKEEEKENKKCVMGKFIEMGQDGKSKHIGGPRVEIKARDVRPRLM